MPTERYLEMIKNSSSPDTVEVWNKWRKDNPDVRIDFSNADLGWKYLRRANFSDALMIGATLAGANLNRADLRNADLSDVDFFHTGDVFGGPFGIEAEGALLSDADLRGAILSGANLYQADLNHADLRGADVRDANLFEANLRGAKLDSQTDLTGASVVGCQIDRYSLECLSDYGGLTNGSRMDMIIHDDVASLRAVFSGLRFWIHLFSLVLFLFPYVWFVAAHWSEARFFPPEPTGQWLPLWKATARFIYNGGQLWWESWHFHWSFAGFLLLLAYNSLRAILLLKTNKLEQQEIISGLPPKFSLWDDRIINEIDVERIWQAQYNFTVFGAKILTNKWILNTTIRFARTINRFIPRIKWGHLVKIVNFLVWFSMAVLCLNTYHFFNQAIPANL